MSLSSLQSPPEILADVLDYPLISCELGEMKGFRFNFTASRQKFFLSVSETTRASFSRNSKAESILQALTISEETFLRKFSAKNNNSDDAKSSFVSRTTWSTSHNSNNHVAKFCRDCRCELCESVEVKTMCTLTCECFHIRVFQTSAEMKNSELWRIRQLAIFHNKIVQSAYSHLTFRYNVLAFLDTLNLH